MLCVATTIQHGAKYATTNAFLLRDKRGGGEQTGTHLSGEALRGLFDKLGNSFRVLMLFADLYILDNLVLNLFRDRTKRAVDNRVNRRRTIRVDTIYVDEPCSRLLFIRLYGDDLRLLNEVLDNSCLSEDNKRDAATNRRKDAYDDGGNRADRLRREAAERGRGDVLLGGGSAGRTVRPF